MRTLLSEGVEPRPGGSIRPMTVMFADIAGFTGLSERLGDRIIPLLSSYLDLVSREVSAHGGTIDKFIGDAVMAFWGAPMATPDHAVNACGAALACQKRRSRFGPADDHGRQVKMRIGINSGDMLVGNIGSEVRLNYTVIGDAVNVASRLEGANKQYGTEIIIGEETRRLAGDRILVRELDRLVVYGRAGGLPFMNWWRWPSTGGRSPLGRALRSRPRQLSGAGFCRRDGLVRTGADRTRRRSPVTHHNGALPPVSQEPAGRRLAGYQRDAGEVGTQPAPTTCPPPFARHH